MQLLLILVVRVVWRCESAVELGPLVCSGVGELSWPRRSGPGTPP